MIKGWFAGILVASLGLVCTPVQSDDSVTRVAAALTLAQSAKRSGDAAALVAATEMLAALAPFGITDLLTEYEQEARFFARGDSALLSRLSALGEGAYPNPGLRLQTAQTGRIAVPAQRGIAALALVPDQPGNVRDVSGTSVCTRVAHVGTYKCDVARAAGELTFPPSRYVVFLIHSEALK